jgi:hypothetical protein
VGGNTSVQTAPVSSVALSVDVNNARDISPMLYGQNYWNWVPAWGAQVLDVKSQVVPLGLDLLRVGGTYPDIAEPIAFDKTRMDTFINYCADVGAAPVYQVPFVAMRDETNAIVPATKEGAAAVVQYLNVTKSYGVTYFSIGNEPDIYEDQERKLGGESLSGYTAAQYCASFAEYVAAMKAVDPKIQILGPELSWKYRGGNDWLTPFLTGCGKDVDIVTVHRYPFDSAQDTAEAVYADAGNFRSTLRALRQTMVSAGVGNKPLAIMEAHVTWDSDPAKPQLTGAPGSVAAGLWVADSLGVAMEEGLWSLAFWSLSESWTLGFIAGNKPKPEYYAALTVGNHFRSKIASVTGAPSGVSVYAGRNIASTPVLFVNKTADVKAFRVSVAGTADPVPVASISIAPYSVTVAEIPDDGGAPVLDVAISN